MKPIVKPFFEPDSCTWTYLAADPDSRRAALIDPVWVYDPATGQPDRGFLDDVLDAAGAEGWGLDWILETHAHADHLSAAALARQDTGAPVVIGRGIRDVQANFARVFNLPDLSTDGSQFDRLVAEGDRLPLGALGIEVMETPGHTNDSVTYRIGDAAFVGDTLFAPAYGTARCDFPGGDAGMLWDSIARIHALPPDTRLFLCHDYPPEDQAPRNEVSVAESRRDNVHLGGDVPRADFVSMREARDATLGMPRLILPALQVNIRAGEAPPPEGNGAAYLKIPFDTTIADLLR